MKLNFKKIGEGQPIIILHGLFGSLDNWMTIAKEWSADFTVYLVDLRNHGQSPHSNEFSYPLMAQDLKELIDSEKIEHPIILGHSMGGKTAMEYAVNYPKGLKKLIVVDIAPVKYEVHHYTIIEGLESISLTSIKSRNEADEILSETIKEFGVRQFLLKNLYWAEKKQLAWRFNLEVLKNEILPISEYHIANGESNCPTLFVKGSKSDYILQEYDEAIKSKFPNSEIIEIEGAGHWVHAEKKDEFSEVVLNFILNN